MPRQLFNFADFRGGINVDSAPDHVADNEVVKAENVDLSERGGLMKRKGTVRLNETSYGNQVEQLIEWTRNNGDVELFIVINSELRKVNETTWDTTLVQALSANKIAYFFTQDKLYFIDGTNYFVYDGTTSEAVIPAVGSGALTNIQKCSFAVRHPKSLRLFTAGNGDDNSALYYSEYNAPDYFKATSVVYPNTGDGPILGLEIFGDAVIVFYKHGVWVWRGIDPEVDAVWEKLPVSIGIYSNDTVELTTNSLTFFGEGGLYSISPAVLSYTLTLQPGQDLVANLAEGKIASLLRGIGNPAIATSVFDTDNQKYLMAYATSTGSMRNNRILVMDWQTKSFTIYTGLSANDLLLRKNGELLMATDGHILKMNEGYSDYGNPIAMSVRTKEYALGYPFQRKLITRLLLNYQQHYGDPVELDVIVYIDASTAKIISESTYYGGFMWGEAIWGEDTWGFRDQITVRHPLRKAGNRIQIWIDNEQNEVPVVFYGGGIEFTPVRSYGVEV